MTEDIRPDWIALDWGMSTLRAWAMGQDEILAETTSDHGVRQPAMPEIEASLLALIDPWLAPGKQVPVIACGIPDTASLRPLPCAPVAAPLVHMPLADPRLDLHGVPNLSQSRPFADLTQGDETALAGIIARSPDWDGVACLPGARGLWAELSAGEVVSFRSFLTAELFELLATQSSLRLFVTDHEATTGDIRNQIPRGDPAFDEAFDTALADTLARPEALAGRMSQLRAEAVLDGLLPATARARLAGLLIGAELAAAKPWWLGREVMILEDGPFGQLYGLALESLGVVAEIIPRKAAILAGLTVARGALDGA